MNKLNAIAAALIASAILPTMTLAGETKTGRYTSVSNSASYSQQNLLATEVKTKFPASVKTVHQALQLLLAPSGYSLDTETQDPNLDILYIQKLPDVHRWIGPMSLYEALKTIAGDPWEFVADPVKRTLSFKLKNEYSKTPNEKEVVLWHVQKGKTLEQVLKYWASKSGRTVIWSIDEQFHLYASGQFQGALSEAIEQLVSSMDPLVDSKGRPAMVTVWKNIVRVHLVEDSKE